MKTQLLRLLRPLWTLYKMLVLKPLYDLKDTVIMWRIRNWYEILQQRQHPLPLDPLQQKIVADLRRDGISITHMDALFPGSDWLQKLTAYAHARKEESFRNPIKTFWQEMWDVKRFHIDMKNPFLAFMMEERNLAIANEYQGMWSRFHSLGLSETIPVPKGTPAIQSQQWHRDIGNKMYPKIFVYLTDVEEEDGPFIYLKGSQLGGRWESLFPQINPVSNQSGRILDTDIEHEPYLTDIVHCTGKAGTVVFADTAGIHKGGYSTRNPRFASIMTFFSEHSMERLKNRKKRKLFTYPEDFDAQLKKLSPAQRFALRRFY